MESQKNIFSPKMQDLFWKQLEPDMRRIIGQYENKESWTHSFEEFPEFFEGIQELTKICSTNGNQVITQERLRTFIRLLAAMPYGRSLSAMSFMDANCSNENEIGWVAKLFIEASNIYKNSEDDELKMDAKVIYERIKLFSQTKLFTDLFTNDFKFGK